MNSNLNDLKSILVPYTDSKDSDNNDTAASIQLIEDKSKE